VAYFRHPDILRINDELFLSQHRDENTDRRIQRIKAKLKSELRAYIRDRRPQILIVENAWALPVNVPLGLAVTETVSEMGMPAIAHHHDFWWERKRFLGSPAHDYLDGSFPPSSSSILHVVINSAAKRQAAYRKGISSVLIPNTMDFESAPEARDGYADDMRSVLGIEEGEFFILQPTRVVPRKRIERSIELLKFLGEPSALVITHEDGDEGTEYGRYLRRIAGALDVKALFASEHFDHLRRRSAAGGKVYSLADAYQSCDIVTYPSLIEGFGNAFLETIYYRRPIAMSAYEIFKLDIQPKGFRVINFKDFIGRETVEEVREVLHDPEETAKWTEENYALGRRYYSGSVLKAKLRDLLEECQGSTLLSD
jgi:glycosyltransferase involved in cell wall biosynthesis